MKTFREILETIKKIKGLKHDYEVGQILGFSKSVLSNRMDRDSIPFRELLAFCKKEGYLLDSLLTEEDPRKPGIPVDEVPRPYCTFVKNLSEVPREIRTEDYVSIPLVEGTIAAGNPIISPDEIEGWAMIHYSQIGRRSDLVAIRLDKKDGRSMEPLIRAGSMVAIDRRDKNILKGKPYAVRMGWGCTIKFLKRDKDRLILIPGNRDFEPEILDLAGLTYDPIVGRVIWNWQSFV